MTRFVERSTLRRDALGISATEESEVKFDSLQREFLTKKDVLYFIVLDLITKFTLHSEKVVMHVMGTCYSGLQGSDEKSSFFPIRSVF